MYVQDMTAASYVFAVYILLRLSGTYGLGESQFSADFVYIPLGLSGTPRHLSAAKKIKGNPPHISSGDPKKVKRTPPHILSDGRVPPVCGGMPPPWWVAVPGCGPI